MYAALAVSVVCTAAPLQNGDDDQIETSVSAADAESRISVGGNFELRGEADDGDNEVLQGGGFTLLGTLMQSDDPDSDDPPAAEPAIAPGDDDGDDSVSPDSPETP